MRIYMTYLKIKRSSFQVDEEVFPLALFESFPDAFHFQLKFNRTLWMLKKNLIANMAGFTVIKTLSTCFPQVAEAIYPRINRFDELNGVKILSSALLDECEVSVPMETTK